jgi:hypothetical protein
MEVVLRHHLFNEQAKTVLERNFQVLEGGKPSAPEAMH